MIVLGVLLLAIVAAVVISVVVSGGDPAKLDLLGVSIDTTVRWVFLTGAVSVLVLVAGTALLLAGLRRARTRRQEMNRLKAAAGPAAEQKSRPSGTSSARATPAAETGRLAHPGQAREVTSRPIPVKPEDPDERGHFESTPRE